LGADEHARRIDEAVRLATEKPARLLAIVGPTASGKTDLAIAVAEKIGGEIVSADSVQIYRGFDIGSGKPTAEEQARARHHLIDALDPRDAVDAASFAQMAERAIDDIRARGKVPILCGGTFFWVRALVLGLVDAPPGDAEIRARHRTFAIEHGRTALHAELARVDPVSAARLHPNDAVRVSRALEVFEISGRPMSEWQASHGFKSRRFDASLVGIDVDPAVLGERITRRAEAWLAGGWIEEVERLVASGYRETRPMGSVGYKEVLAYLDGHLPREALLPTIVQSTRIFARRQRTWLKHADLRWLGSRT